MNQEKDYTPETSYWPLFVALGILLLAVGVVSTWFVSVFGLVLLMTSIIGWAIENDEASQREEPTGDRNES